MHAPDALRLSSSWASAVGKCEDEDESQGRQSGARFLPRRPSTAVCLTSIASHAPTPARAHLCPNDIRGGGAEMGKVELLAHFILHDAAVAALVLYLTGDKNREMLRVLLDADGMSLRMLQVYAMHGVARTSGGSCTLRHRPWRTSKNNNNLGTFKLSSIPPVPAVFPRSRSPSTLMPMVSTSDRRPLSKDEIKRMDNMTEKTTAACITAKSYAYNLRKSINNEMLAGKFDSADKTKLETHVNKSGLTIRGRQSIDSPPFRQPRRGWGPATGEAAWLATCIAAELLHDFTSLY
ncbi:hypothetical protein EVG20_g4772 [Dentipellis fragilis]|uniref:Uncharacterized protein n=1 Tax=Dentipellis fragilis TaxID=205917 RepID=A0A4Y9YUR7_9AGAM|nr:hypothetical protein EVG20_g4772 [Dentipellis fragilis]